MLWVNEISPSSYHAEIIPWLQPCHRHGKTEVVAADLNKTCTLGPAQPRADKSWLTCLQMGGGGVEKEQLQTIVNYVRLFLSYSIMTTINTGEIE